MANYDERTLARIDPTTRAVTERVALAATPTGVAVGTGSVWVAHGILGSVSRVGLDGALLATIDDASPRANGGSIAVGEGGVWFASAVGVVARIDASTNTVVYPTGVAGSLPSAIAAGFDSVWVANAGDNNVVRMNPRTNGVVGETGVGGSPRGVAVGDRAIWVTSEAGDYVSRIDAASGSVETIPGRRRTDRDRVRRGRRLGREQRGRDRLAHRSGDERGCGNDRGRQPADRDRGRRRERVGLGAGAHHLRQTAARSR